MSNLTDTEFVRVVDLPVIRYAKLSKGAVVSILFYAQENIPVSPILPAFLAAR